MQSLEVKEILMSGMRLQSVQTVIIKLVGKGVFRVDDPLFTSLAIFARIWSIIQGCHWSGKSQGNSRSGNFVIGQGNLEF